MKKITYLGFILCLAMVMASCGSSKPAVAGGDVEVVVPCSGPEYQSNSEYFRASSMGLSTDMTIAKKKAMSSANAEIAAAIQTKMKSVTDDYFNSYQNGENDESKRRFEGMSRAVVDQTLRGLRIICEKTMKSPEGNYKVYLTVELAGDELVNALTNKIKADEKLRTDFEYEKFKKVFEEEMAKKE